MGNSKLPASISYDRQGECPGPCDERRKFIIAIAKWKLFKINFTVFHWEYIHCSTIIRTICLTRKRAGIFKIHKRGDYELGCVISYELTFLCTVGRIRCFEVRELKMPFFLLYREEKQTNRTPRKCRRQVPRIFSCFCHWFVACNLSAFASNL